MAAVGSRRSLYSEWMGMSQAGCRACGVSTMLSWTSERKPCWGPNRAASVTSAARRSRCAVCWYAASIEAGLQTRPTRRPASSPDASSRSIPGDVSDVGRMR